MNALMNRSSLFDDIFKDLAPAFYVRPLHGDPLPTPAQIKVDVKENDKAYTVQAEVRYYGAVSRSFQLPQEVDQAQARAKYDNGVLTLTLPKKAANGSQRLTIE